ncbi:NADH:flavin oxidoreductase/NADH oxidase [Microbacterium sp. NPDC058389]|uniref:NADH:flavin oxidoreductase/NADH oxidase n=1 Tax=Microbacterium sp. NPDC058389 TaxID=3346475 RepID=UPI00364E3BE1
MPSLFDPLKLRDVEIPNRIWMSPMCTYSSAADGDYVGFLTPFHHAHYAARAAGGVGLVVLEATAVTPTGRITPNDLGIWDDEQIPGYALLVAEIHAAGAKAGIEIAHAGRKGSTAAPWHGGAALSPDQNGWTTEAPSPLAFTGSHAPHALSVDEINDIVDSFAAAARRADEAGFDVLELHAAHGYLLHSFLSPVANDRSDEYGGTFENRIRIVLETVQAIRKVWPETKPLFVRVSSTDWIEENEQDHRASWTVDQTVQLASILASHGVDLIDASSGGIDIVDIPHAPDYQSSKAAIIRARSGVPTAAVGRIDTPARAQRLVEEDHVDAVFIGRALLRTASWANDTASVLGAEPRYVHQYAYAL